MKDKAEKNRQGNIQRDGILFPCPLFCSVRPAALTPADLLSSYQAVQDISLPLIFDNLYTYRFCLNRRLCSDMEGPIILTYRDGAL